MSKQPRRVRDALASLKSMGIQLPDEQNPLQLWLLVVMHPCDTGPGEVFVTHGKNFDKFDKKPGFEVIGHSYDRQTLTAAARRLTKQLGPNYTPKFSNANKAPTPSLAESSEETTPETTQTPDDYLDFVGRKPEPNN